MKLEFGTLTSGETSTGAQDGVDGLRAYTPPSIRSGLAFEPVLAATCTNDDAEDEDCAGSPSECF